MEYDYADKSKSKNNDQINSTSSQPIEPNNVNLTLNFMNCQVKVLSNLI